ncbi:hypothetical protein ACOMHN_050331 [Nucella lapillus]
MVDPTHFNCSVDIYPRFWHHLECNRQPECEDGRDEGGHCPYSSPACDGLVASRDKCFRVLGLKSRLEGEFVRAECRKNGADMVSIKTEEERTHFLQVYRSTPKLTKIYVGYLGGGESVPFMYRRFDRWADKTIIYNLNHLNTDCCCDVKPRTGAQFEPDGNMLICVKGLDVVPEEDSCSGSHSLPSQNDFLPAPSSCDWMTWNDCLAPPATSDHLDTAITSLDSTLSALMSLDSGQDQERPSPVSATASDVTAVGVSPFK